MMWDGFGYGGMGWGAGIFMFLFWALIIGLIIWAVVTMTRHNGGVPHDSRSGSAIEILKERYARGEINREEFEEKKRVLS